MRPVTRAAGAGLLVAALGLIATPASAHLATTPTLTGFASLPALTFVPGSEPSGAALGTAPVNGIAAPWDDQPVQGFSGVLPNGDGTYDVLSDNGFGNKANSADFLLRIHRIGPVPQTGKVDVLGGLNLTDPDAKVPFPLTRTDRVLTGSDFDVESIVRDRDGSLWIGDEFGPWLLHFDRAGRLLTAPIPLPDVRAPENPAGTPNLGGSKGFEGMAHSPDGRYLYPLLEGTVAGDTPGDLRFNEFDVRRAAYTGKRWTYRLDSPSNAIGDAIPVDANRFLIIERDNNQGDAAALKRIYLADRRDRNHDGVMDKTLVVDLLAIANPRGVGGFGKVFRFPFVTIEDVALLDGRTIAVLNDNNFPGSAGRTPGVADNNEFITVKLPKSLNPDPRVLP
ncbi:esterase-like activity of phytase family protein [Actinoplanes friuliensis]|uniref:esterase-like activity of phytase family protein n=1 Tax=Actinoplanes friuliensis TaxID=196914 RepID=UPI000A046064|nr:esterase-like activity of phytase family protein [Actinoplanes friuliensis]